jgi:hypothetical protein
MKRLENASPAIVAQGWVVETLDCRTPLEILCSNAKDIITYLLRKPLFIAMLEQIQAIVKKLRLNPTDPVKLTTSFSPLELVVMEYIITRYGVISPINTITEIVMQLQPNAPILRAAQGSRPTGYNILNEFLIRSIVAPYEQGSSLGSALTSVMSADLGIAWRDIVTEFSG